jgi:hypothetical protein
VIEIELLKKSYASSEFGIYPNTCMLKITKVKPFTKKMTTYIITDQYPFYVLPQKS